MTLPAVLAPAIASARWHRAAVDALMALPLLAAVAAVGWRGGGPQAALLMVLLGTIAATAWIVVRVRRLDAHWFIRRLDRDPDCEDSADLLFREAASLGPLQKLQRERLEARLQARAPALAPAWPGRPMLAAWLAGIAGITLAFAWPGATPSVETPAVASSADAAATHTTLASATLTISPPAYTRLEPTRQPGLSAKAPAGARLRWALALSPQPRAVELVLHDGERIELTREGDAWIGEYVLAQPALYRIVVTDGLPLADDTLHRLDALPDQPPRLRVIAPERTLTLRAPGQRDWALRFEASDDYGLASARLRVILAQGSGEQVAVSERMLAIRGDGDDRARIYATTLDLASLGLAEGDDLIVRLEVADNREPSPQSSRSPSLILRWPPPAGSESTGMEGLVKRALPAYFRSQRQIIIDAEELVSQRPRLEPARFGDRSDAIGVDQRILRMRYGEFLGEENAGQPDAAGHDDHDDHDEEAPGGFGAAIDTLAEYGHTHDDAEAATLLDPETRALLKAALDAMWSSEGELRQARPEQALPHAYRALGYIKQVQQATRIYLARVGLELPAIDEARRMTGKREGIGDRRDGLRPADVASSPALELWQALGAGPVDATALAPFGGWLRANQADVDDALGLLEALETLRAQPGCGDCRARLRARLWPLLPRATPAASGRAAADAEGRAYLDALRRGEQP